MTNPEIDLQLLDKGYGIKYFVQKVPLGDGKEAELIVQNLKEQKEKDQADATAGRAWRWALEEMERIKDYLSVELARELEEMRRKKEKNVPPDDAVAIRRQLEGIAVNRMTCFPGQGVFTLDFPGQFGGNPYRIYVSVNDDFTFKRGSILTMGGFKPPKDEPETDLSKAENLYTYHKNHGSEAGLYKHYAALCAEEIAVFVDKLVADRETKERDKKQLALYLALFSHACGETLPDALYRHLIEAEIFYPAELYLRADKSFANELITLLGEVDDAEAYRLSVNHILCALAMMPSQLVSEFLLQNSCEPLPVWAQKLRILPREYAKVGGWEALESGPRMLFRNEVTAFVGCKKEEASPLAPVRSLSESCGFCGQLLTLVFEEEPGLATCLHCACYQTVFTETAGDGVHWHPANMPDSFFEKNPGYMKNDEEIAARFPNGLRPSVEKRLAMWSANEFANLTHTQIGGMPTAINDIEYPCCPGCGSTMEFAAQFDMADIEDGEGIYYFFVCEACRVCGANYGQS